MIDLDPSRYLAVRPRSGCFPALFLLAGLLARVAPLHTDNPPTYLFEIDSSAAATINTAVFYLQYFNGSVLSQGMVLIRRIRKSGEICAFRLRLTSQLYSPLQNNLPF